MALGSGEAANEHITGQERPEKSIRNARLKECVDIMRALFAGETVSHSGLVHVDRAKLWTRPKSPPPLIGPAVREKTAGWVGSWADGLITVNQPTDRLRRMIDAFRNGGGEGKPLYLQVHLSYANDDGTALQIAHHQWRSNVFDPPLCWDLELPEHFDEVARTVRPEDMHGTVLISSEPSRFIDWLSDFAEQGFDGIYLHHVGTEQRDFIETFGAHVLPAFSKSILI